MSITDRVLLRCFFLCFIHLPLEQHHDRRVDPHGDVEKRRDGPGAVDEPVDQKRRGRRGQRARAFLVYTTCGVLN